jgi:hypothetical protein
MQFRSATVAETAFRAMARVARADAAMMQEDEQRHDEARQAASAAVGFKTPDSQSSCGSSPPPTIKREPPRAKSESESASTQIAEGSSDDIEDVEDDIEDIEDFDDAEEFGVPVVKKRPAIFGKFGAQPKRRRRTG